MDLLYIVLPKDKCSRIHLFFACNLLLSFVNMKIHLQVNDNSLFFKWVNAHSTYIVLKGFFFLHRWNKKF